GGTAEPFEREERAMQRKLTRRGAAAVVAVALAVVAALVGAVTVIASDGDSGSRTSGLMVMPDGSIMPASEMPLSARAAAGASYWNGVSGAAFRSDGTVRTYYIRADPVVWNYAPTGKNQITGKRFDEVADTYVKAGPGRIGSRYMKCLYRGYTDATF